MNNEHGNTPSKDKIKNKKSKNVINIQKFNPFEFEKESIPFTPVCNKVINLCTNTTAGFIWIYLQSKPPTWSPCKWEIMKRFNLSERTYQRHMRYLSKTNLVENHFTRNPDGTIDTWRIKVLNGTRFNHLADNYSGNLYDSDDTHTAIDGDVVEPAPANDSDHTATNGDEGSIHTAKKPHSGEMATYINKRSTTLQNKEEYPPISSLGGNGQLFSLSKMLEDNPHNIPESTLKDWMTIRKTKKAALTETAWRNTNAVLCRLVEKGLNAIECFETMVASGWQGMKDSYFEKEIKAAQETNKGIEKDKIMQRELDAEKRKREEIEASKGFVKKIQTTTGFSEAKKKDEDEMKRLGMTASQYYSHILDKFHGKD